MKELEIEEDGDIDPNDPQAVENENERLKYAIPVKILDAAEKLSKKVMQLKKDEYGDLVFDCTSDDSKESKNLRRAGQIMQFWINKMFNKNDTIQKKNLFKEMFKPYIETSDQAIQADETKSDSYSGVS